jgi:hypothetical protein
MVPCAPLAYLVVGLTAFAFGVLKRPLHPVALKLHPGQGLEPICLRCIAERYFGLGFRPKSLGRQNKEAAGFLGFSVPYVNRKAQSFYLQRPSGGIAKLEYGLLAKLQAFYSRLNLNAARIGLVAGDYRAFPAYFLRKIGLWVFKVYGKIRMKIHPKTLAHLVQFKAKPGAFLIAGIRLDPAVPKTVLPSVEKNLNGKLLFGAKDSLGFRDPRFFEALRILGPLLVKVQLGINRDCKAVPGKHPEHRHLAVVDFAETTKPLPGDSDRHRPLLGKAALIYQKTGPLLVTQTLNTQSNGNYYLNEVKLISKLYLSRVC